MKSLTKKRQLLNLGHVDLRKYYHGIIINLFPVVSSDNYYKLESCFLSFQSNNTDYVAQSKMVLYF